MRWFRSRVRVGVHLALFALAVQFVLSFAHVHVFGARPQTAAETLIALFAPATPASSETTPARPANPNPKGLLGDACALCTVIQMAGSALPAVAAHIPLPCAVGCGRHLVAVITSLDETSHLRARARAPPTA